MKKEELERQVVELLTDNYWLNVRSDIQKEHIELLRKRNKILFYGCIGMMLVYVLLFISVL